MKKKKEIGLKVKNFLIIFFALSFFSFPADEKIGFLLKGNEYNLSLIKSGILKCICKTEFSPEALEERENPVKEYTYFVKFKGENYYEEEITVDKNGKKYGRITAYNGECTKVIDFEIDDNGKYINMTGAIYPDNQEFPFCPQLYSIVKRFPALMQRAKYKKFKGKKIIEGIETYEIEIETQYTRENFFVDYNHGYYLKKAISTFKNGKYPGAIWKIKKLKKFGEIWFPVKATRVFYSNGKMYQKDYIEVKEIQFNLEIPDSTFTIQFPEGLLVWDGITKKSFIVGSKK